MRDEATSARGQDKRLERVIVLHVLRDDRDRRWSRTELEHEIGHGQPLDISAALATLGADHVVCVCGESVWASRALRCLDQLELIAI